MEAKNLTDLHAGDRARVVAVKNAGAMRRRLTDLGLIEGTEVCCRFRSPYGDPAAYVIRGAVIALRDEDACGVIVC